MKTLNKYVTVTAVAACLGAATPAWTDTGSVQKQAQSSSTAISQQQPEQEENGRYSVLGKVVDTTDVRLAGAPGDQHKLVKVQTAKGRTIVVDLGANEAFQVQKGDRIYAVGRAARINHKPVLFARYFGEMHPVGSAGGTSVSSR